MTNSRFAASRRHVLCAAGAAFATAAVAADGDAPSAAPGVPAGGVHVAGSDEIPAALVGCGGRGGSAITDAFDARGGRVKLTAMADVFPERIVSVRKSLEEQFKERIDVTDDRMFIGFDAYRKAIDALPAGGIAIFATPPAFRAAHFAHAIERGVHVFMEKPVSIDGPSTRRIIELAPQADARRLKVAVGLMCRHCDRRRELQERLRAGEAGEIIAFRGYRTHTPIHDLDLAPGPEGESELMWQVKRFHNFLWASGGVFSDYCIHHIDEVAMMKGGWPTVADAVGGRHFKGKINDQNFDVYSVEYTFDDGVKFFYENRLMRNCRQHFGVYGQGSKGAFTVSTSGHSPAKSTIYRSQRMEKDNVLWTAEQPEPNPYRREWDHFIEAIVTDTPYNEAIRGAEAGLVTAMGRFSAHVGRPVTFQEMLECPEDLTAGVEHLTLESPAPIVADAEGRYPLPNPGRTKFELRGDV
ncbi:MAG: Gfo/Idh/MocA family protein [Planctomycetota bacterium]